MQTGILDYITPYPIPDLLKFQTNEYLEKMISGSTPRKTRRSNEDEDMEGRMPTRIASKHDDDDPPFEETRMKRMKMRKKWHGR